MNIRNNLPPIYPVAGDTQVSAHEKATSAASTSPAAAGADRANVSGAASLLSRAASLPDVRAEKVASIQAAISAGTYNVSSADVASSLISHMLGSRG